MIIENNAVRIDGAMPCHDYKGKGAGPEGCFWMEYKQRTIAPNSSEPKALKSVMCDVIEIRLTKEGWEEMWKRKPLKTWWINN